MEADQGWFLLAVFASGWCAATFRTAESASADIELSCGGRTAPTAFKPRRAPINATVILHDYELRTAGRHLDRSRFAGHQANVVLTVL